MKNNEFTLSSDVFCTSFGFLPASELPKELVQRATRGVMRKGQEGRGIMGLDLRFKRSQDAFRAFHEIEEIAQARWEAS